jgi:hypothetical protein
MYRILLNFTAVAFFALMARGAVGAQTLDIEDFYGHFEGKAMDAAGGVIEGRDISVDIKEGRKGGFNLSWSTEIQRADGRVKRKSYTVGFVTSGTDNVYASAMRKNVFGKAVPLDPMKGQPYVWATLSGATLTVYALVITDQHGYEMQTYRRTRTDTGMELEFHRVRDGVRLKDIRGTLSRTSD